MTNLTGQYVLASGLIGFRSSELRCKVTEHRAGLVWIITADLLDAGTRLVLDEGQVTAFEETQTVERHQSGLVYFG